LAVLLIAGYFVAGAVIHKKVDAAIAALPPSVRVSYASLESSLLNSTMDLRGVHIEYTKDKQVFEATVDRLGLEGIHFLELARTKRLRVGHVRVEGIVASEEKMHLALEGRIELDSVYSKEAGGEVKGEPASGDAKGEQPFDAGGVGFGALHVWISRLRGRIPGGDETIHVANLELDSRKRSFKLDSLRIEPVADPIKMGREKGHQIDVWEVRSEGFEAEGLDVEGLLEQRLIADRITVHKNHIFVFRDRRLPLEPGEKALPVSMLKASPLDVRIGTVKLGPTLFEYKEFPKEGDEPGTLTIHRMTAELEPLITHPEKGDPAYLTLRTEGSLMNSGVETATTKLPLHKGDAYEVDGAFHELDVTKLNNPAENLGHLHLESGMLDLLNFHFEMNEEASRGQVDGRYHELVVEKLKKNGKVDKFKSFALKQLIIPKNKEKAKGKVNYKRDRERYFSYYLLHSLLVGVKSSFSLGFLLPG